VKHLKTFENFSQTQKVDEFLVSDMEKIEKFLEEIEAKVKNSSVVDNIQTIVNHSLIDPYETSDSILQWILKKYSTDPVISEIAKRYMK
jgi:hypothetical protein